MSELREALELAEMISGGVGDDREGWYGAAEALSLARALVSLADGRTPHSCSRCSLVFTGAISGCPRDNCPVVAARGGGE
jgi:hypothetical protein